MEKCDEKENPANVFQDKLISKQSIAVITVSMYALCIDMLN